MTSVSVWAPLASMKGTRPRRITTVSMPSCTRSSVLSSFSAAPKKNGPSTRYTSTLPGSLMSSPESSSNACRSTRTLSAMRRMNSNAASTTPTFTATTRSTNTLSKKVKSSRERRGAQHARHVRGVGHVPRHHEQNGGERGQRDVRCERSEQQDDQQQEDRVDDARQRAGGAVADIGGGTRDGSRGREAAEQRREDVGRALANELLVGIVARAGHAVGDHGGQQRFDGT